MPNSYSSIVLHTVFSTKYRAPTILAEYELAILNTVSHHLQRLGSRVIAIECVPDHIHIVHTLPRTIAVSKLIQEAKKWSTRIVNRDYRPSTPFEWQVGYATFSVDPRRLKALVRYVKNQKRHHGYYKAAAKKLAFETELERHLNAFIGRGKWRRA